MDLLEEQMSWVELLGQRGVSLPCLRDQREEKVSALRCSQSRWGSGQAGETEPPSHSFLHAEVRVQCCGGGGGTFWKTSWVGSSKACIGRARGTPRWERAPFWLGEAG